MRFVAGVFTLFNLRDAGVGIVALVLSIVLPYYSRFDFQSSSAAKAFALATRLFNGFAYSCTNEFTNTLMQRMSTYVGTLKTNYCSVINRSTDQEINRLEFTGNSAIQKVITIAFKAVSSLSLLLAIWSMHGTAVTCVVAVVSVLFMIATIKAICRISLKVDRNVQKGQKVMRANICLGIEQDDDAPVIRNYRINERVYISVIGTMAFAVAIAAIIGIDDLMQLYVIVDTFKTICTTAANDVFEDLGKFWTTIADLLNNEIPDGAKNIDKVSGIKFHNVSFAHRVLEGLNAKSKKAINGIVNVINHLTLKIGTGITVLTGKNGIGKSSFIAALVSSICEKGSITFRHICKNKETWTNVKKIARKCRFRLIAIVDQGSENQVEFTRDMITELVEKAKALLAKNPKSPLADLTRALCIDKLTGNLSGGQKMALIIWRILLQNTASILCLDESLGELDEMKKIALLKYLEREWRNRIVIIVDHGSSSALKNVKHTEVNVIVDENGKTCANEQKVNARP